MIRALEKAESSLLSGFNYQFSELEKRYIEAKDNVKFLTTLERHFKHIRDGPLVQILDTLPSMMNALRMVWVISRHYKDDQRMEPLFGRIGWEYLLVDEAHHLAGDVDLGGAAAAPHEAPEEAVVEHLPHAHAQLRLLREQRLAPRISGSRGNKLSDPVGRLRAEAEKEKAEENYGGTERN